ncbi:MAG TPA: helix-turn-helix domain-containing protein [Patescibacteria group bacterium]|jgi:DNA-binding HxlR family transcriptional regulator|nr:helix-turn-helix domain-containing protein [Patescibacteria group bacterium]
MPNKVHNKCSNKELKMLGDFWTLAIIQALHDGDKRFAQLQRDISRVNPTTLTSRLKRLEKQGIIKREEETVDKLSVVYSLTPKGTGILPILKEIRLFADKFL